MAPDIFKLRERLKEQPMNWDLRLSLADAFAADGMGQQAAIVVSTAPREPDTSEHLARAARHLLTLDSALAIRYTNAALAADETNAEAALVRAEAHRVRNEPAEAHRFFVVASALDPSASQRAGELAEWLARHDLATGSMPNPPPRHPRPETAEPSPAATRLISSNAAKTPLLDPASVAAPPSAAAAAVIDEDPARLPVTVATSSAVVVSELKPPSAASPNATGTASHASPLHDAAEVAELTEIPVAIAVEADEEARQAPAEADRAATLTAPPAGDDSHAIDPPAPKRMLAQKLSAASVAVLVHVGLFFLLGVLVVMVPQPKVAEIVGVLSPEVTQEQPETKQVVASALPAPSVVAAAPTRAISAAGLSAVALPAFDAKGTLDIVPEIATTDMGSSFSVPFSPKGTSAVNFFGIKSKGRRVAFLIDAERYMLTDPRGGYPAYQIVKEEIAGMIGKLGLETLFNVILYEGRNVSAFSERLLPATAANKARVADWLYPVNREFERLGIQAIRYPVHNLQSEVEPVNNNYLTGYLRAIQYAIECDVDAVFIILSGYRSMETPRTKEDMDKLLKQMNWTEKDDIAWREAAKKGQEWLARENAARKAKGIPERVIVNIGEVWRDMGLRPPRSRPGGIQITPDQREEQVQNAIRLHYLSRDKPKPQINFVIFIGKDQDEDKVPMIEHFENIAQRAKNGKVRVLKGMAALKNVTGRK